MRINVYRITYYLTNGVDQKTAETALMLRIGQSFREGDFDSAQKINAYLESHSWPKQTVVSNLFTEVIAAETEDKAVAGLPAPPAGQSIEIQQIRVEMKDVFLAT